VEGDLKKKPCFRKAGALPASRKKGTGKEKSTGPTGASVGGIDKEALKPGGRWAKRHNSKTQTKRQNRVKTLVQ